MKLHHKKMSFSKQALELLLEYPWPGNIRELQNTMERIVLICPDGELQPEMLNHVLPFNFQKMYMPSVEQEVPQPVYKSEEVHAAPAAQASSDEHISLTKTSLQDMEKDAIIKALIENRGIQTKAAKQLGMTARQIGYKIKKYDIDL